MGRKQKTPHDHDQEKKRRTLRRRATAILRAENWTHEDIAETLAVSIATARRYASAHDALHKPQNHDNGRSASPDKLSSDRIAGLIERIVRMFENRLERAEKDGSEADADKLLLDAQRLHQLRKFQLELESEVSDVGNVFLLADETL